MTDFETKYRDLVEGVRQIEGLAKVQAMSCQAAHRADHARNWLDVLAIIERALLASSPAERKGEPWYAEHLPADDAEAEAQRQARMPAPAPVSSGEAGDCEPCAHEGRHHGRDCSFNSATGEWLTLRPAPVVTPITETEEGQ